MPPGDFTPGFRFSWLDLGVLVIGAVAAVIASRLEPVAGFLIAYVLGHFFLFCNVFRISRRLEYLWAACFVVLAACTVIIGVPGWIATGAGGLICAAVLITIEMRQPSYHGIGWQRINPGLRQWFEGRQGSCS